MSADSPFPKLVAYWLEDMEIEDRLSRTTRNLYERDMRTLVLRAFKNLMLREIGVPRCDYFLKHLAKRSYSSAKHAASSSHSPSATRSCPVTRWTMSHGCTGRRPSQTLSRSPKYKTSGPRSRRGESRRILAGPRPDRQLGQIVEVMLGTSAGIENVTPHRFRRTVANNAHGALFTSELLGRTDPRITMQHYIQCNGTVDPAAADYLECAFGKTR